MFFSGASLNPTVTRGVRSLHKPDLRRRTLPSQYRTVKLRPTKRSPLFSSTAQRTGACRYMKTMSTPLQDLRYSLRTLRKSPGFASVAILALAVGIGANTIIFSLVNAVILKPLPYREPGRLVRVREAIPKLVPNPMAFSAPDVPLLQKWNQAFESVASYEPQELDLSGQGQPQRIDAARISANLLETLGVSPSL